MLNIFRDIRNRWLPIREMPAYLLSLVRDLIAAIGSQDNCYEER